MKTNVLLTLITSAVIFSLIGIYSVGFYNKPPIVLENEYLKDTSKIEIYKNGERVLIIDDPTVIKELHSNLSFRRLQSGKGFCCAPTYIMKFITPNNDFSIYFLDLEELGETTFYPNIQYTLWDKFIFMDSSATQVPVYEANINFEMLKLLLPELDIY